MKKKQIFNMNKKWIAYRLDETLNEGNESTWTWIYKGLLSGFKTADKKGDASLDAIARSTAFLIKTEFGGGAKNDFIKALKKYIR